MAKRKDKLKVYFFHDNTGVGYYRGYCPALWLKKLGLCDVKTSDWRWTEENDQIRFPSTAELEEIGYWADLIVFQRHDMPQHMAHFMGMAEHFNIPLILDTDDNIEAVRPYNPGYGSYHPGAPATEFGKLAPRLANAITVTTDDLYRWHAKDNENRYILPNSIDVEWRSKFKKAKHPKGEIHFGWIGSSAHYENLLMIKDAVLKILEKYPNTYFHFMDMYGTSIWNPEEISPEINNRIIKHPWATLRDWPAFIAGLGLDIGLAPAVDNLFNRAKSNLRYLEYSFYKTAVVASPTECYSCIKDGVTGLHAMESEDWFEAIERLILDPKLRKSIGEAAHKDVIENYNMKKNIHLWAECYEDVVRKYRDEYGPRKFTKPE